MPELPEVETVCRGLRAKLVGKKIEEMTLHRASLRWPIPPDLVAVVTGQKVTAIDRRSKVILIRLQNKATLLVHLGMSGRLWFHDDDGYAPTKHDHVVMKTGKKTWLVFNDARRFGMVDVLRAGQTGHKLLDRLGVDPFSSDLTPGWLWQIAGKKTVSLKTLLMDQRIIAGLGNIYVSEALFTAKLWPERAAKSLTKAETVRLVPAIRKVLASAIEAGGSSLRDYVQVDGELGYFQDKFQVYGRTGQPCKRCGTEIQKLTQAGRSSFACPTCQK